jgi:hypothetical protein
VVVVVMDFRAGAGNICRINTSAFAEKANFEGIGLRSSG